MRFELVVFDLDGTLVDSKVDLANAVNATRADARLPPLEHETIFSYVGDGAPALIRRAIGDHADQPQMDRSLQFFLSYYRAHMLDHTRLYPGAREALDSLRAAGVKMAVLTNKPVRFSRDMLRGLGLGDHFVAVHGGNSFESKKPHPEGLERVMQEAGVDPERTLVVGDSAVDVETARNAGTRSCGVTYGFQPATLAGNRPDLMVDSLPQLADLILSSGS